jgi:outer membrane protein assembly factor BamB
MDSKRTSLLAATLSLSLLASTQLAPATDRPHAAASEQGTDWPEFMFDRENTGENPLEATVGPENVAQLQLDWSIDFGDFIALGSSPVLSGGVLYTASVATPDGYVRALDPLTGLAQWVKEFDSSVTFTAPAVAEGVLVVGSGDSNIYALDAATGKPRWTFDTGFGVFSSPTILNGVVYVGSNDDNLYALSLATGEVVWTRDLGNAASVESPAVASGVVYASTEFTRRVFALDAASGRKRWSRRLTGGNIAAGPVVDQGRVFVTTEDGFLVSLDASTGGVLWRVADLGEDLRSPAVAEGMIYVGSTKERMFALDAATGDKRWATRVDGTLYSPIVANGVVYSGGESNKLYSFDATSGDLLWTAPAGWKVSNPILVNGRLYFGSFDNHLYAYSLP